MTKRSITYEEGFLAVLMRLHFVLLLEDIANRFWVHSSTISGSFATWIRVLIVEMRSIFQQLLHTNVKFSKASISVDHARCIPVHSSRMQIIFCCAPFAPALTLRTEFSWLKRIPIWPHIVSSYFWNNSHYLFTTPPVNFRGSGSFGSIVVLAYI